MTITTDHLTPQYVEAALRAIVAEHPDWVNPLQDPEGHGAQTSSCAYTGPDGSHCVFGQFLVNEGLLSQDGHHLLTDDGEEIEGTGAASILRKLTGQDEWNWRFATNLQSYADNSGDVVPWGEALAEVDNCEYGGK